MGSDAHYPEQSPAHRVYVDGVWINRTPVTNRQFREFVRRPAMLPAPRSRRIPKTIRAPCQSIRAPNGSESLAVP